MPDIWLIVGFVLISVVLGLLVILLINMMRMGTLLTRLRRPSPEAVRRTPEEPAKKAPEKERSEGVKRKAETMALEIERVKAEMREELAEKTRALHLEQGAVQAKQQELARREEELARSRRIADEHEGELVRQQDELLQRMQNLTSREDEVNRQAHELQGAQARARETLEQLAGLTTEEARAELISRVEHESRLAAATLAREIEQDARQNAAQKARHIIVESIQRLASEQTAESVVSTVPLPSEDMKGRIIGKEGRNIRAFEQVTGVNVMIDDTPETVLLSCFDPVRRETARIALIDLITDGRIHPSRIEEAYERATITVEEECQRAGEDALLEMKITDLDPLLVSVVGSLQYRTSYGQNVLRHLVECGHLAAMMAAELGLDVATCRRAAFLHDIGKALSHENEGSHALAGAELLRRHGELPDIVHAVEAHHREVEPQTVEAVLTQAADAISGGRPGARRDTLEAYVKRLERLEEIAQAHEGVDRVFAMQAGREIRVMVSPDAVSDAEAQLMARSIATQVHDELTYPGVIKITVVRESRATEMAR